jgi:hypothetical protein
MSSKADKPTGLSKITEHDIFVLDSGFYSNKFMVQIA